MKLVLIDWIIIVGYFVSTMAIGAFFTRRAGKSMAEFFVSGRSLPWWVAGTSMVATTFAADTPLAVTGLMVKNGLAGNWFWWAFAVGGMFTVFVYARLWRRAEVMTDVELIKLRYSGSAAAGLRYLRAFYVALIVNPIIIGWVIGAMLTVLEKTVFAEASTDVMFLGLSAQASYCWATVVGMLVVVGIYCTLSGMWGVAIADVLQFCLAMGGCIWLAVVAVDHVGGIARLEEKVEANFGDRQAFDYLPSLSAFSSQTESKPGEDEATQLAIATNGASSRQQTAAIQAIREAESLLQVQSFGPEVVQAIRGRISAVEAELAELAELAPSPAADVGSLDDLRYAALDREVAQLAGSIRKATPGNPWLPLHVFLIMLAMQWWATWYPGAEPGGGGYVVQRMASCKDEQHAALATLWYQIAHYCVRPWPWIMISFVALAVYPDLRANYIADDNFDPGEGFPRLMAMLCTPGLAGLMLVAFFAAFMSTMSTQMNWGASYLVRDFVQPLMMTDANDQQMTRASRIVSLIVLLVGLAFGVVMKYPSLLTGGPGGENDAVSVDDAWKFLAALGAGTGLVFMLRWFWWRINAWSEISAMLASLGYFLLLNNEGFKSTFLNGVSFRSEEQMAIIAGLTIVTWLAVTFVTPAESRETLGAFFRKIRPGGPGWKPIAIEQPDVEQDPHLGLSIVGALFASGIVYLTLPMIGYIIFGKTAWAIGCAVGAVGCTVVVAFIARRVFAKSS